MTARIEIGRLSAVDLGKTVTLGDDRGLLTWTTHYIDAGDRITLVGIDDTDHYHPPDTLIDITGTPSPKEATA